MDVSEETNRQAYVVVTVPKYDKRRIRALQNKRYRRTAVYEKHLEAGRTDVVYRWRVFKEQAKRGSIQLSITLTSKAASCAQLACWRCGGCACKGYSGVDRVQNAGTYHKENVSCKFHERIAFSQNILEKGQGHPQGGLKNTSEAVAG